jgi:uncharacterized protein
MVIVPWQQLKAETLDALIEEFVTRHGAEHGHRDVPLERKLAQVRELLHCGKAVISFDEEDQTVTIVLTEARRGAEPPASALGGPETA